MRIVLDAGAFLLLERGDRAMWRRLEVATQRQRLVATHGGVVAQIWRGGSGRQALLARALRGVEVVALDEALGRQAGLLLAATGTSDAVDAAVVAMARPGDRILTSDPGDIDRLVDASGHDIEVVPV